MTVWKRILITFILLLSPSVIYAQNARLDGVAQSNTNGFAAILPFASITVTPSAFVYPNISSSIPASQPIIADANGNYNFYAAPCTTFNVVVTATGFPGYSYTWTSSIGGTNSVCNSVNHTKYVDGIIYTTIQAAMTACLADAACGKVDASGAGTAQTNTGAFTIGSSTQSVNLVLSPGVLTTNATISVGVGPTKSNIPPSGITCVVPSGMSSAPFGDPPCIIKAANGSNLPSVVSLNGDHAYIGEGVLINGNNTNNTTCGVAILVNKVQRVQVEGGGNFACTHGIEFLSSTQLLNESGSSRILHGMFIGNRAAGIYAKNTGDLTITDTESQNNGTPVNLSALTVTVTGGTSVAITSGSISTDSSLIGTAVRICTAGSGGNCAAGVPGSITFITAISSTTALTVSPAISNGVGLAMTYGGALESNNSQWYITAGTNFGESQKGLFADCSTAATLAGTIIEGGIQYGNNTEADLILDGSESGGAPLAIPSSQTGAVNCLTQWHVSANFNGSNKSPDATHPMVLLQDGGQGEFNIIALGSVNPNRSTYAMQITESGTAGTSLPNYTTMVANGSWSVGPFIDSTLNAGTAFAPNSSGSQYQWYCNNGAQSCAFHLFDSSGGVNPNKYIRVTSGSLQVINSAFNSTIFSLSDGGTLQTVGPASTLFNVGNVLASGTATMTTAAIGAGACGATVTIAAANIAASDSISWSFAAAPAGTNAGIVAWPTSGNVNFAYCPGVAETPAAATINWRVNR